MRKNICILSILTFMSFMFAACEHDVNESKQVSNTLNFAKISGSVFTACAQCHSSSAKSGDLDISSYENIVNVPSSEIPLLMRIKPSNPDSSYIYMKVTGASGIIGSKMPQGGTLSADKIKLLSDWIKAGAVK
jgi:hypothetical protein